MNLDKLLDYIEKQQEKEITGIPLGCDRFNEILPSIEKGSSWIVLGGSGSGKTALVIDKFLVNAIRFAFDNPKLVDIHIDYFNLEETEERHDLRVLSNMAYRILNVEYSLSDMVNQRNKKKLLHKSNLFKPLDKFISFFNTKVTNYQSKSPSKIKSNVLASIKKLQSEGVDIKKDNFYYFLIIDNLKFLKKEAEHFNRKDVIDDLCLNIIQDFRIGEFKIIPIILQHTSVSQDNMIVNVNGDVIDNKLKPSLASMGDSNDTQTPATNVLGIFKPHRFGIKTYPGKDGYDITALQDNIRFLIPLKARDNSFEGTDLPIHFKGNVSVFEEMPTVLELRANKILYDKYKAPIISQTLSNKLNYIGK